VSLSEVQGTFWDAATTAEIAPFSDRSVRSAQGELPRI